jgi:hypothetical protein
MPRAEALDVLDRLAAPQADDTRHTGDAGPERR